VSKDAQNGIPGGWKVATIADVSESSIEQAAPDGQGVFLYVDISSIENRTKKIVAPKMLPVAHAPSRARQRLRIEDVLVSMTRPNLNAVAMLPPEMEGAVGSTGFHVMRAAGVEAKWLFYLVQTQAFIDAMSKLVLGVLYPAVRPKDIRSHSIPLAPVAEQLRIVAEIEKQFTRLEAAVKALKRVQTSVKRYRASVLKAACEGRLVPTEAELARAENRTYEPADKLLARILKERRARWESDQLAKMQSRQVGAGFKPAPTDKWKAKYKEPAAPDTSKLLPLSEGWAWTTLLTIAFLQGGITKGQKRKPGDVLRAVPYLRVANVQRGFLDLRQVKSIEATDAEIAELKLLHGDVLFTEGGDRDKLGRGVVWKGEIQQCIHQNHIFRARLFLSGLEPQFLSFYGNSLAQAYFVGAGKQTTNLASINLTKLSALPVPLPPLQEQHRIIAEVERRLSVIDELEATVETNLKRAERLRQSILKRGFEGKLVPQDPNDEPASLLLERIRDSRPKKTVVHLASKARARRTTTPLHRVSDEDQP
jgi:type I restriction enzyme S subunit